MKKQTLKMLVDKSLSIYFKYFQQNNFFTYNTYQIISLMQENSHNIYTNFKVNLKPYSKKIKAVIMGHCGNGKTSFINKLCNTNHKIGITGGSVTRDIEYESVILNGAPENTFILFDTPGSDSKKLAMQHAQVIRKTLQVPLNLILLQSKFDERFDQHTFTQLVELSKIFKGYENNVVLLVSHADILDNIKDKKNQINTKQQVLELFGESLKQNEINFKVILYSNKDSSADILANILYSVGFMLDTINMKITDKVFYKYFTISDLKTKGNPEKISQYIDQIQDISDSYIRFLNQLTVGDPQNDELIADLKAHMKYDLKTTQKKQFEKYENQLTNSETSDLYLLISQHIQKDLETFDNKSSLKIVKQYYYEYDKKNYDIRDLFKKCPSCGKIWMRADGCDGKTHCGNKPDFFDFFKSKKQWKYSFKRDQQKIICTKNQLSKLTQQQVTAHQQKTKKVGVKQVQTKDQGCGQEIIWRKLPRLPDIESILYDLYGISNFEQNKFDHQFVTKFSRKRYEQVDQRVKLNEEKLNKSRNI